MKIINGVFQQQISSKALELGIPEDFFINAIYMLSQNKEYVNAMDNRTEMDDYIYRAIIKSATEKRRRKAEQNLYHQDIMQRMEAEKDLTLLSKEQLLTDPHYRAILPLIAKILVNEPVLRLHADEASEIILQLADFKRRYRATSVTEVIVTRCRIELEAFSDPKNVSEAALVH